MSIATDTSSENEFSALIDELVRSAQSFDGMDRRGDNRIPLICAVTIQNTFGEETSQAFSRDISADGIGLITSTKVPIDQSANLSISRFDGASLRLSAVSRWCTSYGKDWYLSGWEYRRLIGVRRF